MDTWNGIFTICVGLLLAGGVAGAVVRKRAEMCAANELREAWTSIRHEVSLERNNFIVDDHLRE